MAREIFAVDEWYHCYSRGVDKRVVFEDHADYTRFQHLLYLCNSTLSIQRSMLTKLETRDIYKLNRGEPLTAIGVYCLMPNHFHLLLRETREGGLSEFMRKIGIAYTMYFNGKNERVGNLFVKPFRAKHVSDDNYFRRVAQYIHLNPSELFAPGWERGILGNIDPLIQRVRSYKYSSLPDYLGGKRLEGAVLDLDAVGLIKEEMPPLEEAISETFLYHHDLQR